MNDEIKKQMERLQFGGKIQRVAEEDLAASFSRLSEPASTAISDRLYAEYVEAGTPRNWRQWIRERIEPMFLCAGDRPNWVGGTPMWAFLNDKPMVFIRQFTLGSGPVETTALSDGLTLYLFGLRVPTETGQRLEYRVVEDHASTRGLVARALTQANASPPGGGL